MSKEVTKHVIEIPDDIPLNPQFLAVYGTEPIGNKIRMYIIEMDKTEELTADYINKHFSDLQDEAYHRGLAEGKKAFDLLDAERDAEYQRGFEEGKAANDKGCEGCKYQANKELTCPCSECANNYKNQWTAKSPIDDGFVRGDEIVGEDGVRGIVVSSKNNESNLLYILFNGYRTPQSVVQKYYKKTGKHYDIDKFLDEIKGEGDK